MDNLKILFAFIIVLTCLSIADATVIYVEDYDFGAINVVGDWVNVNHIFDGNWSTYGYGNGTSGPYGSPYVFFNYSYNPIIQTPFYWQVSYINTSYVFNYTIPLDCIDGDGILEMAFSSYNSSYFSSGMCRDKDAGFLFNPLFAVDSFPSLPAQYIYEEGMYYESAENLSTCVNITTSGWYVLNQSISGSQAGITSWCVNVSSDDVLIDCNGFNMSRSGSGDHYAIWGDGVSNVTVQNCNFYDWEVSAVYFKNSDSVIIKNSNDYSSVTGFEFEDYTNNSQMINLTAMSTINEGFEVDCAAKYCNNITLVNISASGCEVGVELKDCMNCFVNNTNIIGSTTDGFQDMNRNTTNINYFYNVTINGSAQKAIEFAVAPSDGYIAKYFDLIIDDIILPYVELYGGFNVNKSILPTLPGGFTALASNYDLSISNVSAGSWAYVNLSYTDADIALITESNLLWYRNNSGSWVTTGFADNFVDATNNVVSMNATSFSGFAPMELNGAPQFNVTGCANITAPNSVYTLQANLTDTQSGQTRCLYVNADNVTINGNGYYINGNGSAGCNYGIYISSGSDNVTVYDLHTIGYYGSGVITYGNYTTIYDSVFTVDDDGRGIQSSGGWFLNATRNNMTDGRWGVSLESGASNASVSYNNFVDLTTDAIHLNDGSNSRIFSNNFSNVRVGVYLVNLVLNHVIYDNIFNVSSSSGIYGFQDIATGLNVSSNTFIETGDAAIFTEAGFDSCTFDSNVITDCYGGIYFYLSDGNIVTNNNITNSLNHGLYLDTSCTNMFDNINVTNSSGYDIYVIGSTCSDTTFTNIYQNKTTFSSLAYGTGTEWYLQKADSYTTLNGWEVIGDYYFELANETAGWININLTYGDDDYSINVDESSILLFKNVSGSWTSYGLVATLDTGLNWLSVNASNFGSIFVPMGDAVYNTEFLGFNINDTNASVSANYSATVNNTGYLSGCIIEHNNSASFVNESWQALLGQVDGCYAIITNNGSSDTLIGWYIWVNDTDGAWTRSDLQTFSIDSVVSPPGGGGSGSKPKVIYPLIYEVVAINSRGVKSVYYDMEILQDNPVSMSFVDNVMQFAKVKYLSTEAESLEILFKIPFNVTTNSEGIRLWQLNNDVWEELDIEQTALDSDYMYFEAFSTDPGVIFALTYSKIIQDYTWILLIGGFAMVVIVAIFLKKKRLI